MRKKLVIILLLLTLLLTSCVKEESKDHLNVSAAGQANLEIHFIDVGQGDSSFIILPNGENILIDGGSRSQTEKLKSYLKDLNIKKIDYLIGTHPHEDHIGSLGNIIKSFDIGKVYLPEKTNNTEVFKNLLEEIQKKGLNINIGRSGLSLVESESFRVHLLGPAKIYDDINNNSIVTKIEFGEFSTIITGDLEELGEKDLIALSGDLKADVLRLGHHGSDTSTSDDFLKEVRPKYGVISVGENNKYNHPNGEVLSRLKDYGIITYRTDKDGNIVLKTDGKDIEFLLEKDPTRPREEAIESSNVEVEAKETSYIGNKNTKVFHLLDCKSLPKEENRVEFKSIEEAEEAGYAGHKNCVGY